MTADSNQAQVYLQQASEGALKVTSVLRKVPVRRWRQLVLVLIAIWLCQSLARLVWVLVPVPILPVAPVVPQTASESVAASGIQVDLNKVNNLFGKFDPQLQARLDEERKRRDKELAASQPVKETTLNLKLQGVIASSDPTQSWAIIGESSQELYKIGDSISGQRNVKVKEIAELWIILDNNGKAEKLWLYGEDGKKIAVSPRPPPVRTPEPEQEVFKAEVDESALKEVKSIGDVVRFMVATENGQMIGYKVRPGRKRELFDQVGLKNDDIVVSVNGIEVNEPQKVREVYQALKTATEANLEVMRDGSTQFIQIRMSSG